MYRWQTLTLARIERLLYRDDCRYGCEAAMLDVAKNVLYYIGQQHFPEPDIADPPRTADAGPAIDLIWRVDEREMVVSIGSAPTSRAYVRMVGDVVPPPDEPADRDNIRELAHWLLFGERPPKAVAAGSRGPKPGDPMSLHYPDFAAPTVAAHLKNRP